MKPTGAHPTRRGFFQAVLATKVAPAFVPARLQQAGQGPSSRITLGVIGVGAQGLYDMRNFADAIRNRTRAICDIDTAVRSDILCQLALIAVKRVRRLGWSGSLMTIRPTPCCAAGPFAASGG